MKTMQDGINNPHYRTGILFSGGGFRNQISFPSGGFVFSAHREALIFDMEPIKRDSVLFILVIEYYPCRAKSLFSTDRHQGPTSHYHNKLLHVHTCASSREKPRSHVQMSEGKKSWMKLCFLEITCLCLRKISVPLQPKPHLARCSFKRVFPAQCPLSLHSGFWSRGTASRSRVLAEPPTETFHQSADGDGSSRIIRAAQPAGLDYTVQAALKQTYLHYIHTFLLKTTLVIKHL